MNLTIGLSLQKGVILLLSSGLFLFGTPSPLIAQPGAFLFGDFGDAPSRGMFVGYNHVDPFTVSNFPTDSGEEGHPFIIHRLPDENGFFGDGVTIENSPLLIDQDLDDGWTPVSLAPCVQVQLSVRVTIPDNATVAPLYLNMLFDWNHDGAWQDGQTLCPQQAEGVGLADEWPIQNLPLHQEPYQLVPGFEGEIILPPILTGLQPGELWTRFTLATEPVDDAFVPVSLGGPGWDGQGDFIHGETEDYFICVLRKSDDFPNCPSAQ